MAIAILALSDRDGQIAMDVQFEMLDGDLGFDAQSHAHQHMRLLLKAMDTIAQRIPDSEPAAHPVALAAKQVVDVEGRRILIDGEEG